MITYVWRDAFGNDEVEALHAEGFGHEPLASDDWWGRVRRHSLGWVCARRAGTGALVGFVNAVWDGGGHAFLVDTVVAGSARHEGVGTRLVALAAERASAAGCEWLHVDFEERLRPFYINACGFSPTPAGLIALRA
ncbi:GNAT family N-acetyltransferase [Streptomyces radicis]|uniref:GNAT family N-acetyltransferase n=1 Tax=Streptomyces radicis TaxID=1750517 RepID=A0A3A9W734_9ACTN|nr:GNAT family N-acetyltransferase [Streptomyces radicis]RKN08619.1 GNAT family N-acetyltransferase [Streptomyces radicis]RKN21777.1 GNAT family N-acetyltransferase [Streptomyces radicis]